MLLSVRRSTLLAVTMLLLAWAPPGQASESFLPVEQAFVLQVEQGSNGSGPVRLRWQIADGYYLYRDRIEVTGATAGTSLEVAKPAGEPKDDPNFGMMEVYHQSVTIEVKSPGAGPLHVTWQGCADAGLCYPPQTQRVALEGAGIGAGSDAVISPDIGADTPPASRQFSGTPSLLSAMQGSDSGITQILETASLAWSLPLFLLMGIALAFTPCMLPMMPIVSGLVVGSEAAPRRAFALSVAFGVSMALTYAVLGVAAALAGANLQTLLQTRWVILLFGALFVLLAMAMFGFFTLQLPACLRDRLDTLARKGKVGTLAGAAGMGSVSALLVGPCMTAPLAGTLLYIARSGHVVQGALYLFVLGIGMALPLVVLSTLGSRFMPRPGVWMTRVNAGFGFLLLATAIWMISRVIPPALALLLWGSWLLGLAVALAQSMAGPPGASVGAGRRVFVRTAASLAGLWGVAMVLGSAAGADDPWQPLAWARGQAGSDASRQAEEQRLVASATVRSNAELRSRLETAAAAGRPTLVDFTAEWCTSCKTIEKEVFGDPRIAQAFSGAVLIKADVTDSDAAQRALMREHQVVGPPTLMFFDAGGQELREARLVGEYGVEDLLKRRIPGGEAR